MNFSELLRFTGGVQPHVAALRLFELGDRQSDVMRSSAAESLLRTDALLNVFRTFARLNKFSISGAIAASSADSVAEHAHSAGSDLVLASCSVQELTLARSLFTHVTPSTDVALWVDTGAPSDEANVSTHIIALFVGGADDRATLSMLVQMVSVPGSSVTGEVLRFPAAEAASLVSGGTIQAGTIGHAEPTVAGVQGTAARIQSDAADLALLGSSRVSSLAPRLRVVNDATSGSIRAGVQAARGRVLILTGRRQNRSNAISQTDGPAEVRRALGYAAACVLSNADGISGVVVIQASGTS